MGNKTTKIVVRFDQQQLQLLDKLRNEGKLGRTYPEIIVNVFRDHVKQERSKGGL